MECTSEKLADEGKYEGRRDENGEHTRIRAQCRSRGPVDEEAEEEDDRAEEENPRDEQWAVPSAGSCSIPSWPISSVLFNR